MSFNRNVFINCPFDDDYIPLLRALLFTIIYLKMEPRLSQTTSSATVRVSQIKQLIRESKFSIHDLSRSRPMKANQLPRFNMPYELGLDEGCIEFGEEELKQKKILILAADKFLYQKVLSDIAGQDIEQHGNDPRTAVKKVRNWFSTLDEVNELPGTTQIWLAYSRFSEVLQKLLAAQQYSNADIREMPPGDYIKFVKDWMEKLTAT